MSASTANTVDSISIESSQAAGKSSPTSFFSTLDTAVVDDDNVHFRVTTTDSPFEKMNTFSQKFDSDQFPFEDYIDRSKRLTSLPSFFDVDESEASDSKKRTSKVRFIIQSPDDPSNPAEMTASTPDDDPEILNIVNNSETFLEVESEDWWTFGRRSPLKIEEVIDPIDQSDNPVTSASKSDETPSIDSPTSNKIITPSSPPDPIKSVELHQSPPDPPNLDQVSHLRNSFLDKMLSDENCPDSIDDDPTCSIIAAHPKSKARDLQLADMELECPSALVKIDEIVETRVGDIGASKSGINPKYRGKNSLVMEKTSGTLKNEVMHELLTNFHSIKLKTIVVNDKNLCNAIINSETDVINSDLSLVKSACSVDKKTDDRLMANSQYGNYDISCMDNNIVNDSTISEQCCYDKCAIVRCNDEVYDNNAMTHVDLRYDQYREDFMIAITPGRVRSFVKNYEISGNETSDYNECCVGVNDGLWQSSRYRGEEQLGKGVGVRGEVRSVGTCLRKDEGTWGKKKSVKFDDCQGTGSGDRGVKVKRRAPARPPGGNVGGIVDSYEKVQRRESIEGADNQDHKKVGCIS